MDWQPSSAQLERAAIKTAELQNSSKPQWVDARLRLESMGIDPEDAVLAEWHGEGSNTMLGFIRSRDGRMLILDVDFDLDESGHPLAKGVGRISRWRELDQKEARLTSAGYPNTYARAAIVARLWFESERSA